ncbi:hypothetical protein SASPL_135939 [Salvia splendens]|uniref:Uncharacterized protein n=1 Tax=Salvia splendens TaxID=180675 RepID=A0A8X8X158_SALSN|nr:hypothetical protein SASPL_135939 [Salvia splendens]
MAALTHLFRSSLAVFSIRRSLSSAAATEFKPQSSPPRVDPKPEMSSGCSSAPASEKEPTPAASRFSSAFRTSPPAISSAKSSIPPGLCPSSWRRL